MLCACQSVRFNESQYSEETTVSNSIRAGRRFVVPLALALCGCGGSDERNLPMSPVSGTVTYTTALPEGQIVFQHPTGEMAATKFGPDGKFQLDVPQGKNQVMVTSLESSITDQKEGGPRAMETYTSRIPTKYASFATSSLEVDVKEGPNSFEVKLTD
jgi:hypothetical protein